MFPNVDIELSEIFILFKITEQQVSEYKASIEAQRQNIDEIRQRWLQKLESLVSNISERFSAFFEHMGYAGEIQLNKGNKNEDDFTNYGTSSFLTFFHISLDCQFTCFLVKMALNS